MKLELLSASNFLVHLIRLAKRNVGESQLQKFRDSLIEVLRRRYRDHWFPEKPFKGSGYRCIRINGKMDPVIAQAGDSCGLSSAFLHGTFPSELTMWIDPLEVSYRIGENGSICVLYEFSEGVSEPWQPAALRNNKNSSSKPEPKAEVVVAPPPAAPTTPSCKETLRMDYLLDPKKSVSIEQLAALVSS
jgi:protein Tob/BTG